MNTRYKKQISIIVIVATVMTIVPLAVDYSAIANKQFIDIEQISTNESKANETKETESDLMLMSEYPTDIEEEIYDFHDIDSEPDTYYDPEQSDSPDLTQDVHSDETHNSLSNQNIAQPIDSSQGSNAESLNVPQPPEAAINPEPPQLSHPEPVLIPQPAPSVIPVTSISVSLNRSNSMYKIGDTGSISVVIFPQNATDKNYQITVNDNSVLTISQTGHFTAKAPGSAIITVAATNGEKRDIAVSVLDMSILSADVMRLTNVERIRNNLPVLSDTNSALNAAASTRAREIITSFDHTRPDGRGQTTAYEDFGGLYSGYYSSTGENIAAGHTTATSIVTAFMNSTEHRANILNSRYTHIGVAVDMDNNGRLYWVQAFLG